jgi:hypothetical protein
MNINACIGEKMSNLPLDPCLSIFIFTYLYVFMYMCTYVYMHVYIHEYIYK